MNIEVCSFALVGQQTSIQLTLNNLNRVVFHHSATFLCAFLPLVYLLKTVFRTGHTYLLLGFILTKLFYFIVEYICCVILLVAGWCGAGSRHEGHVQWSGGWQDVLKDTLHFFKYLVGRSNKLDIKLLPRWELFWNAVWLLGMCREAIRMLSFTVDQCLAAVGLDAADGYWQEMTSNWTCFFCLIWWFLVTSDLPLSLPDRLQLLWCRNGCRHWEDHRYAVVQPHHLLPEQWQEASRHHGSQHPAGHVVQVGWSGRLHKDTVIICSLISEGL